MKKGRSSRLYVAEEIQETLDKCGLPYEVTAGKKHIHIKIMGRLVGILPRNGNDSLWMRSQKNVLAQIKRAAIFLKEDPTWVGRA